MALIIEIARLDGHPNWDIDWGGKFSNANGNLFFIWTVISAVSILTEPGLITMKDNTGPVHVNVGMLEIIPGKKDILDVRDDLIPIRSKDFKDPIKGSFAEGREGKYLKYFRTVDPIMRSLDAKVIRQFVADECLKQLIDIDTPRLVFPENIIEVQDFIQFINKKNGSDRKGYIFIRLKLIGS